MLSGCLGHRAILYANNNLLIRWTVLLLLLYFLFHSMTKTSTLVGNIKLLFCWDYNARRKSEIYNSRQKSLSGFRIVPNK